MPEAPKNMPSHKVIQFSQPVKAVSFAGMKSALLFTHDDIEAARREGYHRGAEETSRTLERQLLEQRAELVHLQSDTFVALMTQHAAMFDQLRAVLPELTMEAVARILGGVQWDRAAVIRIVDDLLGELAPSGEAIEVQLNPSDLAMVSGYEENLREKFPAIAFRPNADLQPGDGVVRSRFGAIDGRLGTKFRSVEAMFQ
jgi:flagellar biosynthesis/type III secretory pathway protein FliH